jgi:2-keto-4-pentenoate hydratase/2-oxohepta-3-ene-1,7-dioic acid hydratase in catechol pathway
MTLEPGDIISTGTPSGIAPIHPGDIVEATVEKIGTLRNYVRLAE